MLSIGAKEEPVKPPISRRIPGGYAVEGITDHLKQIRHD